MVELASRIINKLVIVYGLLEKLPSGFRLYQIEKAGNL
jgi:hypothetical protein